MGLTTVQRDCAACDEIFMTFYIDLWPWKLCHIDSPHNKRSEAESIATHKDTVQFALIATRQIDHYGNPASVRLARYLCVSARIRWAASPWL